VEKAIHDQGTGRLVQFVFDRLAADRNLDDDVDIVRRTVPDLNGIDPHGALSQLRSHYNYARLRHATKEYAAIDQKSWNARLSTRSGQVSAVRMMFGIAVVGEILLRSDNLLVMS
jgi:hypothetical protein